VTAAISKAEKLRILVRVVVFIALVLAGRFVFPGVFAFLAGALNQSPNGLLIISALVTFATAALANAFVVRGWEQGKLSDFGMGWTATAGRELLTGILSGAGAAFVILIAALLLQLADFRNNSDSGSQWSVLPLLIVVLVLGALGEELMFHGYAFQHLVRVMGEFATVLPVGLLFGLAHAANQNVTLLAVFNTMAWGILLGFAYLRTRTLWLPIGLHFGWNLALLLLGINLSGFTIGVTGYSLHWKAGDLWSGGNYGLEGGLFTTMIVIALFALLPKLHRASAREPEA
jgi:membrane protease YdiL (CAAX protease family)